MASSAKIKLSLSFIKFLDNAKFTKVNVFDAQIRPFSRIILEQSRHIAQIME